MIYLWPLLTAWRVSSCHAWKRIQVSELGDGQGSSEAKSSGVHRRKIPVRRELHRERAPDYF